MKTYFTCIMISMLIAGCTSTPSPEFLAKQAEIEKSVPVCVDERDCNAKWEAAQLWVIHNSAFKIQTATSVLIETYNAVQGEDGISARVTKEPMGNGKYKFVVNIWCDRVLACPPDTGCPKILVCRPSVQDATLDFNKTVGAATP